MYILKPVINFILDTWLWNMTWGWYQLSLAFIFMWILIVCIGRMKSGTALLLILGSYVTAFSVYSLFVVGVLMYWLQWELVVDTISASVSTNVLAASLYLGAVYTFLQSLFFCNTEGKILFCISNNIYNYDSQ